MSWIREPAVAGSFYPSDPDELRAEVQTLLDGAAVLPGPAPRALIVPHAGYAYSGPVAASAYSRLVPYRDDYRRVVLLGPAHRVPVNGVALPGAELFRSPLGLVPVDASAFQSLDHPAVSVNVAAHRGEHSLEVQLPFLQVVLGQFNLVPLLAGVTDPETVADVILRLWDETGTLVVVSSDLSHYLDYRTASGRDRLTCEAIESLDTACIGHTDACGSEAVKGLLLAARHLGLAARTVDLRNSGDTAGPRDRVVGFGAWTFVEGEPCRNVA